MRIDLIFPAYPPFPHAVGEYTALLAAALRQEGMAARVICAREQSVAGAVLKTAVSEELIDGVHVVKGFNLHRPEGLLETIQQDPPAVAILQYCPFSWGIRGRCPGLTRTWRQLAQKYPAVGRVTMFHELWTEEDLWRARLMKIYQKPQATAIARASDYLCFSCDYWYRKMNRSVADIPAVVIPVGSNIPVAPISPAEARERLGIPDSAPVLGLMGTGHPSRRFDFVAAAFRATLAVYPNARLLYIGSDRGVLAKAFGGEQDLRNLPVIADGWADELETSRRLAAVDVYCCPFSDGVSLRRGSFIAGLAHGLVCLSTRTDDTDPVLIEATKYVDGAIHLVDAEDRNGFAQMAVTLVKSRRPVDWGLNEPSPLYQHLFAWNRIAKSFIDVVEKLRGGRDILEPPLTRPTI